MAIRAVECDVQTRTLRAAICADRLCSLYPSSASIPPLPPLPRPQRLNRLLLGVNVNTKKESAEPLHTELLSPFRKVTVPFQAAKNGLSRSNRPLQSRHIPFCRICVPRAKLNTMSTAHCGEAAGPGGQPAQAGVLTAAVSLSLSRLISSLFASFCQLMQPFCRPSGSACLPTFGALLPFFGAHLESSSRAATSARFLPPDLDINRDVTWKSGELGPWPCHLATADSPTT